MRLVPRFDRLSVPSVPQVVAPRHSLRTTRESERTDTDAGDEARTTTAPPG
ncbi:hypothetical protein [Halorussus salinus]|uniref:hypothetical protein n=1 Tax=Halorussus salinus TaxID=1364935 RepID=UPI00138F5416|nr:hypothetical protein [Halorussus salinus]